MLIELAVIWMALILQAVKFIVLRAFVVSCCVVSWATYKIPELIVDVINILVLKTGGIGMGVEI